MKSEIDTTALWRSLALSPIPSMFYQIKNARCLAAWKHYKEYCADETGEISFKNNHRRDTVIKEIWESYFDQLFDSAIDFGNLRIPWEDGDLSYTSRIRSSRVNGVLKKLEIQKQVVGRYPLLKNIAVAWLT
ncbi:hypothetical protein SADUNF_Sadunf08G0118100 [Salix dunnii]|uniref:Uncharacterized protein n=1 Tax=Salix dunnii TaxID=1413687 RepID=A0A835MUU3_9ROSI|nr:hypothetical protein SADUNF_Sadunf08G0118100 [Salix dunnii]